MESVAEHIYKTCILAIAIDSEFDFWINLQKVIIMLVIHELEEIIIGDYTPYDSISKEKKLEMGRKAVQKILGNLTKKEEYLHLTDEYNQWTTPEARFAKMCDKLEADLQAKRYEEEWAINFANPKNKEALEHEVVKKLVDQGEHTISNIFIEHDRKKLTSSEIFLEILDFVKEHELKELDDS